MPDRLAGENRSTKGTPYSIVRACTALLGSIDCKRNRGHRGAHESNAFRWYGSDGEGKGK